VFKDALEWPNTPNNLEELICKLAEGSDRENANFAGMI
jgi:hypothetical protein